MRDNKEVRLLAYLTGLVNQRLLLRNECLIAENRILRSYLLSRFAPLTHIGDDGGHLYIWSSDRGVPIPVLVDGCL